MHLLLLLLSLFTVPLPPAAPPAKASLLLEVANVRLESGTIWVGIYESEEDFLVREKSRLVYQKVRMTGTERIVIDGLTVGKRYAIALFHDENDNGELDTNLLGLPAEPWAFSRPLRSYLRKPRFEEMSFVFDPNERLPTLRLRG